MTTSREIEAAIEAVLFATPEPVPRGKLFELFPDDAPEQVEAALDAVTARYRTEAGDVDEGRGVILDEIGSRLRLVTRPDLHGYLRKFFDVSGRTKLSMAALETLAIVAYRQPLTAPEIQELRGKNSSAVLKTLLERRLIRISGRKEVVGKPFLYSTTREFLLHFGLERLEDLPPLEEFEEAFLGDGDFSGEGLEGEDREETILRAAAAADDAEEDDDDDTEARAEADGEDESADGLESGAIADSRAPAGVAGDEDAP